VTTNYGGWRKTTLLNPAPTRTKKPRKAKKLRTRKGKKMGMFGWTVLSIFLLMLLMSGV
jgi:cytoskeletal protein RodZ